MMRTNTFVKKPSSLPRWLQKILIRRKRTLTTEEAALYLKTSLRYVYFLICYYYLPSHRNHHHRLLLVRKEIDRWLKVRHRKDFPKSLRKSRAKTKKLNNDL